MKQLTIMAALLCGSLVWAATPAHAFRLVNLDQVPHTVTLDDSGEVSTVTLQPNESYRTVPSFVTITLGNHTVRTRPNQEWAIFPGAELSIQKRNSHNGHRN